MFGFNDITLVLLSVSILFYIRFFYINRRIFKFAWKNHGFFLPVLPGFGTTYISLFTGRRRNVLDMAKWLQKYIGHPLNFWLGHNYLYVTVDADELKTILNHPKCLNKSIMYNDAQHFFGKNSLVFVEQEAWKGRRRHLSKSFKPNILKGFIAIFNTYSGKLVEEIKKLQGALVPSNHMNSYVFNTLCVTAFGLDHQKFGKELAEFGSLREKIEQGVTEKLLNPILPFSWWTKFFPTGKKTAKYMARTKVILEKIIRERKMEIEQNHDYIENSNEVPLLDLILCYNNEIMTDKDIYEEIVLFASAGTESSSLVLYLGCILLGIHPDVQEKMFNEITSQIGDTDFNSQNIGNLRYVEATIYEVMRLVPVLPFIARVTSADVDLGNNKVIPEGVDVAIDLFNLHREKKYWKDPLKFEPTRFLPENADKIVPYSYMPFSNGPRDCLGKFHAMALLKTTYANIVRNFKIATTHKSMEDIQLCSSFGVYPTKPVDLRFILRKEE